MTSIQGDTLKFNGTLFSSLIDNYLETTDDKVYIVAPVLAKYSGTVYFSNPTSGTVVQAFNLETDSVKRKTNRLTISNAKIKIDFKNLEINPSEIKQGESVRRNSFEKIIQSLSNEFNIPIKVDVSEDFKKTIVLVKFSSKDINGVLNEISPQLPFTFIVSRIPTDVTYYYVH